MLYASIGQRDWINEDNLIEEVNRTYREQLIDFSSLITLRDADPTFQSKWKPFQDGFYERIEELKAKKETLPDQEYKEKLNEINLERDRELRSLTALWLQEKLKKLSL